MEAEQVGTKRRKVGPAANVASLACSHCNRRHIKCDGKLPCASCVSSGFECEFPQTVKKRGPQPGEKKQLQALVKDMAAQLSTLREQRDFWQQKAEYLEAIISATSESSSSDLQMALAPLSSSSPSSEIGLSFSIDLSEFIHAFEQTAAPLIGLMPPALNLQSLSKSEPSGRNLQLLAMISTGARALGRSDIADEYFQRAIIMSNGLFGQVSADVAGAFNLISLLFTVAGVEHEAILYANTSNRMLESLVRTDSSQNAQLQQQLLLSRITHAEGHVTNMPQQHDLFAKLVNELGTGSSESDTMHALAILGKTRAWITVNASSLDQQQLLAQLASQLALLQRAENMYTSSLRSKRACMSTTTYTATQARIRSFIGCMRAALYASAGLAEIAVGMFESLLADLGGGLGGNQPFLIGIDSIIAATSLAEAMLRCGRVVEFNECCTVLSRYASGFPIAGMIVEQLKAAASPVAPSHSSSSSSSNDYSPLSSSVSPSDPPNSSTSPTEEENVIAELQELIGAGAQEDAHFFPAAPSESLTDFPEEEPIDLPNFFNLP